MLALLGCVLSSGLLAPPLRPAALSMRARRICASEGSTSAQQQAAQELLAKIEQQRAAGKTDSEILENIQLQALANDQVAAQGLDAEAPAPPPAPLRGEEPWGRWSQSDASVNIEFFLEDSVRGRDVVCEVAEGWLCVGIDRSYGGFYEDGVWGGEEVINEDEGTPPLIFGRFAQRVVGSELSWTIDEEADGRRTLCIELPKHKRNTGDRASVDCIFDESLHINGTSCVVPGLSQGTITLDLPLV